MLKALTVRELIKVMEESTNLDDIIHVDIGATNNYKVIKSASVINGSLIIHIGERYVRNSANEKVWAP